MEDLLDPIHTSRVVIEPCTVCDNERFVSFVSILVNISKRIYWKCLYIRCMQTNSKKAFNVYTGTAQNHVPIFTLLLMQFSVFTQTPPTDTTHSLNQHPHVCFYMAYSSYVHMCKAGVKKLVLSICLSVCQSVFFQG